MAVVSVDGAAFAHPGGAPLFEDVAFRVRSGQHVALVGANGVGKSTLLRCIAGEHALTEGTIHCDGTVALMPQAIGTGAEGAATVRDLLVRFARAAVRDAALALDRAEAANAAAPSEATGLALSDAVIGWADVGGYDQESRWDAACDAILGGGLDAVGGRAVATLSGGERKRLVLESLLASDADALLLDEPDNFLDIPAKRWLERRLRASPKTVLVVSHDRELLADAADAVVTVEGNGAWTHPGGWATYRAAREARNQALGDARARWKAEERRLFQLFKELKQRASVSDTNAKKAAAAEHRWERWVEAGPPPPPPKDRAVRMRLAGADSGRIVLRCERLALTGLTDPFDLEVHLGDRVAVLGPNGTGKSHLLRLLAGDATVGSAGTFRLGARVVAGLFHQTDEVAAFAGRTPLEVVRDEHDLVEGPGMAALGRYGLAECARRPVETLSGGQQARLQVLGLELSGVNLLLLDEPTDNLDLGSAEALDAALAGFVGTVVAVTHDRWFLRAFDRFVILDDDGSVVEALDRDAALHAVTGDPAYPTSKSALVPLSDEARQRSV
ncbi:ABC-F family ATP-binding cassette domain-containing protein [Iamia sp. SCSIO 61187]|uniref:ABC-F family ATP-binding cassette domain-containing protein n=1 Tax=Iamia sp. SCSIO 61187 TaxID=2722752 RepID=UPI001C6294C4|nr:ATP-binding cassette domain-containing protein [Iamia sp. SCSIO 61187]QYG93827.1 ABC-F family ATP-binding cassette domain-containing protein [Iamia sp. SCSIO 61187]